MSDLIEYPVTLTQADVDRLIPAGWAPGEYIQKCGKCGVEHVSDKRARRCLSCAIASLESQKPRLPAGYTVRLDRTTMRLEVDGGVVSWCEKNSALYAFFSAFLNTPDSSATVEPVKAASDTAGERDVLIKRYTALIESNWYRDQTRKQLYRISQVWDRSVAEFDALARDFCGLPTAPTATPDHLDVQVADESKAPKESLVEWFEKGWGRTPHEWIRQVQTSEDGATREFCMALLRRLDQGRE